MDVQNKKILRLIDANLNRTKEGLRVCEDIVRFIYDERNLTRAFKKLRHDCTKTILQFPIPYRTLVSARDSRRDVGKNGAILEKKKMVWSDLLTSNLKRAEESLRVLEEVSKMVTPKQSSRFQSLRFKLYELEKRVLKQF